MVQCYYKNDDNPNLIRSINSGVCMGSGSAAGFYSCCFPWDQCLPDGICYANSSSTYYSALCTDQALQDSSCQKGCNGLYRTGLKYNTTDDLWTCCDQHDSECSTTTNATFDAPAPAVLLQKTMTIVDFIPTSTTAAATSSTTASGSTSSMTTSSVVSSSSTTLPTTSSAQASDAGAVSKLSSNSSMSTGAVAGISVGIVLVVIAIVAGLLFWFLKRRRRNNQNAAPLASQTQSSFGPTKEPIYGEMPSHSYSDIAAEKQGTNVVEAPTPQSHFGQDTGLRTNRGGVHELN